MGRRSLHGGQGAARRLAVARRRFEISECAVEVGARGDPRGSALGRLVRWWRWRRREDGGRGSRLHRGAVRRVRRRRGRGGRPVAVTGRGRCSRSGRLGLLHTTTTAAQKGQQERSQGSTEGPLRRTRRLIHLPASFPPSASARSITLSWTFTASSSKSTALALACAASAVLPASARALPRASSRRPWTSSR